MCPGVRDLFIKTRSLAVELGAITFRCCGIGIETRPMQGFVKHRPVQTRRLRKCRRTDVDGQCARTSNIRNCSLLARRLTTRSAGEIDLRRLQEVTDFSETVHDFS